MLKTGVKVGGTLIKSRLGTGGYSEVYEGTRRTGRVAVKVFRQSDIKYFQRELAILEVLGAGAARDTDNVRRAIKSGAYVDHTREIRPFIMFNLYDTTASKLIRIHTDGLIYKDLEFVIRGLLNGIRYLHSVGVIHADVKPGNILLNGGNGAHITHVALGDMGSSSMAAGACSKHIGTQEYTAPETILKLPYVESVDIWAACVTIFELASGKVAFDVFGDCSTAYTESMARDPAERHPHNSDSIMSDEYTQHDLDYKQLLFIDTVIGPPPEVFTECAQLFYNRFGRLKNDVDLRRIGLSAFCKYNIKCAQNSDLVHKLLDAGLKYLPDERASARELCCLVGKK